MTTLHNGLVSVQIFSRLGNGSVTEITPGEMNHLGRIKAGTVLLLRLVVSETWSDHVVLVTTNRDKSLAALLPSVVRYNTRAFEHQVVVLPNGKVDNNGNLVRLLTMSNKGVVVSNNVAIIVQKGEFYLAPSQTYRVQAYRAEGGKVAVPELYDSDNGKGSFIGVKPFIDAHYVPQYALPPVSSFKDPGLPDVSSLPSDNAMVVLSWSLSYGTGVGLRKDGGKVKLHYSKVNVADRIPVYLFEGEIVIASRFVPAPQGSSLLYEAEGITRTEEMIPA